MRKPKVHVWLETILNFLYLLFISPFRFRYDDTTNSYKLISSTFHKIFPVVIHTFGILYTFIGIYSYYLSITYSNPRCMFHFVVAYSRFVIYYALLYTLWTRRQHFLALFSFESSKAGLLEDDGTVFFTDGRAKVFVWCLCFSMIFTAVGMEVFHYEGSSGFEEYIFANFGSTGGPKHFEEFLGLNQHPPPPVHAETESIPPPPPFLPPTSNDSTVLIGPPPPHPPGHPHGHVLTSFEYGFTIAYTFIVVYVRICNHVALLFCIISGVTLYLAANTFISSVENDKDQDKVIDKYNEFWKFGSCLNKVCGLVTLSEVVCSPPFFIVYMIGIFTTFETIGPRILFYSCMYCLLFGIASEAASKAGEFKEWIIEYGQDDHECQLFAIFVDVSQNPMGLRGMGCFTITYGFVAKMFATIITFTIILLQFETTPPNPMTNSQCH